MAARGLDVIDALMDLPDPAPIIRTEMVEKLPRLADLTKEDHGKAFYLAGGRADGPLFAYFYPDPYFRVYDDSISPED